MISILQNRIAVIVALLMLAGCASNPVQPTAVVQDSTRVGFDSIGTAAVGDVVGLPQGNALGLSSVVVDSSYTAASGRTCRRMRTVDGETILRVVCQGRDGSWRAARDISPNVATPSTIRMNATMQSISGSAALKVDGSDVDDGKQPGGSMLVDVPLEDDELAVDLVVRTVQANETLWSFARRTTGNALNWQKIADINDVGDARTISGGDVLQVPADLVRDGV